MPRAGSFGTYEANLDWNTANADGDRNFRVNGVYLESDGYRDVSETSSRDQPGFTMQLANESAV